jgi:hypothetical protein
MKRRTLTASLLIGLLGIMAWAGISVAGAARSSTFYLPSKCNNEKIAPRAVIIGCADLSFVLRGLDWGNTWGGPTSVATGKALVNDCRPDCASGTSRRYPIVVTAGNPKTCIHLTQYKRLVVRFTGGRKPAGFSNPTKTSMLCGNKFGH